MFILIFLRTRFKLWNVFAHISLYNRSYRFPCLFNFSTAVAFQSWSWQWERNTLTGMVIKCLWEIILSPSADHVCLHRCYQYVYVFWFTVICDKVRRLQTYPWKPAESNQTVECVHTIIGNSHYYKQDTIPIRGAS